MADLIKVSKQVARDEIRVWDFDFSNDLRTGVTVSSATATHTPPAGGTTVTPTVGSISGNVVPVSVPALTETGVHYLECLATLSDGEKSTIKIQFDVIF